jgi:dephospho-CoA kinase
VALIVGLTGGIGSGKTLASDAFARRAIEVVDTDRIAHAVSAPDGPALPPLRSAFGDAVFRADGSLDRDALRRRVFADADARGMLESILHPLIGAEARRAIAGWRGPYGIVVVPLLLERGGLRRDVDRVLVVDCPEQEQVRRVMQRNGLAESEVRAIMATQVGREARLAAADDVIDNSGAASAIEPQVDALDRRYRALASK